jgi:hypothetical protein
MRFELARERLVRPVSGASPPEVIDGGIAERAVEPRNNALVRRRLLRA